MMVIQLSAEDMSRVLPGSWGVCATNFPIWLDRATHSHLITFRLTSEQPLFLRETVSFGVFGGKPQRTESTDRWMGNSFARRSIKRAEYHKSRWSVAGASVDENVLIIRFAESRRVPDGLSILVRTDITATAIAATDITASATDDQGYDGIDDSSTRTMVAGHTAELGLSIEDFASLGWLEPVH